MEPFLEAFSILVSEDSNYKMTAAQNSRNAWAVGCVSLEIKLDTKLQKYLE